MVESDQRIDGSEIKSGDVVIGLSSSGVHSNGYALIHRLIEKHQWDTNALLSEDPQGRTLGEALLEPTRIYVKTIQALLKQMPDVVKGMAHVTGGGLAGNLERPLSDGLMAVLMEDQWQKPAIFKKLLSASGVSKADLFETFNMGIGFCVVVDKSQVQSVLRFLAAVS